MYGLFFGKPSEKVYSRVYSLGARPKVALSVLHRFSRSSTCGSTGIATFVGRVTLINWLGDWLYQLIITFACICLMRFPWKRVVPPDSTVGRQALYSERNGIIIIDYRIIIVVCSFGSFGRTDQNAEGKSLSFLLLLWTLELS